MTRHTTIILALSILTPYAFLHSQSTKAFNGFALVDKSGNISKSTDYRDKYELLGTYTIIDPQKRPNAPDICFPREGRVLRQDWQVSRWRGAGEGNLLDRSRQIDHGAQKKST